MKVNHALILAAGKGTRMGEIGKILPKVIWPVFEKSILELEVEYAKKLGASSLFVNLYNYKDILLRYMNSKNAFDQVDKVIEKETLDVGGAIHNLALKLNYEGNLLILNSDQFIMFDPHIFTQALNLLNKHDVVLFTYDVSKEQGYNKLEISENRKLNKIISNQDIPAHEGYETYTGMCLIKLNSLEQVSGKSNFFESVANPKKYSVYCKNIENASYWDFGTTERYHESMFNVLKGINLQDDFIDFLIKNDAINKNKVKDHSYNCLNNMGINLSSIPLSLNEKTIVLDVSKNFISQENNLIVYFDLIQKLS